MTPSQIKSARKALGLSTGGFARAVGVDPRTVQRWERTLPSGRAEADAPGPLVALLRLAERLPEVSAALIEMSLDRHRAR